MKTVFFYWFLSFAFIVSCSNSDSLTQNSSNTTGETDGNTDGSGGGGSGGNSGSGSNDWLIPIDEVRDGGPGKDGIPSIDNPIFIDSNSSEANYLDDSDLIVGIVKNNEARAYPHAILDWHEIVNDQFDDDYLAINYCPLTGTAFAWRGFADFEVSTFGVSGLLYNTNLILYDRHTDSNWSQLRLQCVNGNLIGDEPTLIPVVETTWEIWKMLYPNTKVLSLETGFSRNYNAYPYGPYKTNHEYFIFPAIPTNSALPNKERVYTIIENNKSRVYRFSNFSNGKVIKETFQGKNYLIVGNSKIINAFELTEADINSEFSYSFNNSTSFFQDTEGNQWSIFGKAISGPRIGEQLTFTKSVVSYWFAIAAFYPNPEIFTE